jgi:hypothetical protein
MDNGGREPRNRRERRAAAREAGRLPNGPPAPVVPTFTGSSSIERSPKAVVVLALLGIIVGVLGIVVGPTIAVRVIAGLIGWLALLALIDLAEFVRRTGNRRWAFYCLVTLALVILLIRPVTQEYRAEQAALYEGDLSVVWPIWPPFAKHNMPPEPILELGDSGVFFTNLKRDGDAIKTSYDSHLELSESPSGMEISTIVRDENGNVIVDIDHNHWTVSRDQAVSWDHNYSRDSLEVLDRRKHPVLQVRVTAMAVQLNAYYVSDHLIISNKTSCPDPKFDPKCIHRSIDYLFEYPSSEHWGETLSKWALPPPSLLTSTPSPR